MKKIAFILIILMVPCAALLAVIQPPADVCRQGSNQAYCHNLCSCKPAVKTTGNSLEQPGSIGI